jgi:hypothetical protein
MHTRSLRFFRRVGVPDQNITGVGRHLAPHAIIPTSQFIKYPAAAIFNGSPVGSCQFRKWMQFGSIYGTSNGICPLDVCC